MIPRLAELALWLVGTATLLATPAVDTVANDNQPARPRSLADPAHLEIGEWWDVEIEDWFTHERARGVFVVTARDGDTVSVGVAANALHPILFNNRLFPLGHVSPDYEYQAYGDATRLVTYPMTRGQSWSTNFGPFPLKLSVGATDGATASVRLHDALGESWGNGTYSAELGWYRELAVEYFATMRVLDHGYAYDCAAVFPGDLRSPPYETPPVMLHQGLVWEYPYTVESGPTHAMISMFSIAQTGFARQQVTAPDGSVYQSSNQAGEPIQYVYAVHEDPAGTWQASGFGTPEHFQAYTVTHFRAEDIPGRASDCTSPATVDTTASLAGGRGGDGYGTLGTTWRLLLIGTAFLARHWRKAAFATVRLFSRLEAGELALNPIRSRILDELQEGKGLSTQDLRRRLGIGWGTVTYHLAVLERHNAVIHIRTGKRQVWANPSTPTEDLGRIAVLSNPQAKKVYDAITEAPGDSQVELARRLGLSPATVHHHVRRLTEARAIRTEVDGRRTLHFPA